MTYISKLIRWHICSFINESSMQKQYFSREVLSELRQFFLKKNLIAQLTPGTRPVCLDFGVPCLNCYHYGINGPCLNHEGEVPDVWLPFSYYREHTVLLSQDSNETWEEYNARTSEERRLEQERLEQERHNQYTAQVQQFLDEYYRQDRIRMFLLAVERPEDYHEGFLFMLIRMIRKELHAEFISKVSKFN